MRASQFLALTSLLTAFAGACKTVPSLQGSGSSGIKDAVVRTQDLRLDSDSFGSGGYGEKQLFIEIAAKQLNLELHNRSVPGSVVHDAWLRLLSDNPLQQIKVPSPYRNHVINLGINDLRRYGESPLAPEEVVHRLTNLIAYLRLSTIIDQNDPTVKYTGKWTTMAGKDFYRQTLIATGDPGAGATVTFDGDSITVGTHVLGNEGGTIQLKVDGTVRYEANVGPRCANNFASSAIELRDLGAGPHTLQISKSDAAPDRYIYIDWIGQTEKKPPAIYVNGITKMQKSTYVMYPPTNHSSGELTLEANRLIADAIKHNFDDRVIFVDQSSFDPDTQDLILGSDKLHPNDLGHQLIAKNLMAVWLQSQ